MRRIAFWLFLVFTLVNLTRIEAGITRQQIMNNASNFQNLVWTMNARNSQNTCVSPTWIITQFSAGSTITGMAYCWGGGHTISQFNNGIAGNGKAGNRCTSQQGNCCWRSNTYGVDCSGFVTRAWGRTESHLGTGQLPGICVAIPQPAAIRRGDIFNLVNSHAALFSSFASNGTPNIIESSATDWKVSARNRPWSYFNGYTPLRYKDVTDDVAGFGRVDQGVTVTPTSAQGGQSFQVTFRLRETYGAPITYTRVTCAILNASNQHLFDLAHFTNVSLGAGQAWSYSATGVANLPTGTYKAVARGMVSNWFDFLTIPSTYRPGYGVNPQSFSVTNVNRALRRPVTVSGVYTGSYPGLNAVDGSTTTYWMSPNGTSQNFQWIYVDLGAPYTITQLRVNWGSGTGYAKQYRILTWENGQWVNRYTDLNGNGGSDIINVGNSTTQYVCIACDVANLNPYSYRIFEFEVYGSLSSAASLASNVLIDGPPPLSSDDAAPLSLALSNYPNPFNPQTQVEFTLPKMEAVTLVVYNIAGQKVRTLMLNQITPAGNHVLPFDGKDDRNQMLPTGVYYYHLTTGESTAIRKMLLMK